jgi:hypothetical protein
VHLKHKTIDQHSNTLTHAAPAAISALIRSTVPEPTPTSLAILKMPLSPFARAFRIRSSSLWSVLGRPNFGPPWIGRRRASLVERSGERSVGEKCGEDTKERRDEGKIGNPCEAPNVQSEPARKRCDANGWTVPLNRRE